jgi:hypothetical protein
VDPFRPLTRWLQPLLEHPRWPTVRALLIAFHLVAVTAVACPAPVRGMNAEAWKRPAVQEELQAWARRATALGYPMTAKEVQDLSWKVQERWLKLRQQVVWPFQKWLKAVNAPQGWYMFTGPDRDPQRFVLSFTTTSSAQDELVFELGRPPARPDLIHPDFLDDHRIRRALFQASWSRNDNTFRLICGAFGRTLRARQPDVDDVRCRLVARRVEHPYRPREERPDRVVRELVLHKDGSSTERREDSDTKKVKTTTKPAPKPNATSRESP